ncbi:MAG: ATP-binding protein [Planctomycetota bacterium]
MYARHLTDALRDALSDTPVVLLVGVRQAGKTTLARALLRPEAPARYLSLDDPAVLMAAQTDPVAFLEDLDGPVVLDEVQQAPALFPVLRSVVDRDRTPGRFLLTGSTHALTTPRVAEALVGRMELLTLWPLSQGEIEGRRETFLDAVYRDEAPVPPKAVDNRRSIVDRALRGGFPEPLGRSDRRRPAWFGSYIATILRREVRDLARIEGTAELPRLLDLLASRSAGLLNFADISRNASIPQTTLKRYIALLEQTFLLWRLPAWAKNPGKRLVKSPKLMFVDTGLLAHLSGWTSTRLAGHPEAVGPLLENFVATELRKQAGWSEVTCRFSHFRTSHGREVDLVLEDRDGRVVGIEVKARASLNQRDFAGLHALAEACDDSFHRGIVLYTGTERLAFGSRMHALPMGALWE